MKALQIGARILDKESGEINTVVDFHTHIQNVPFEGSVLTVPVLSGGDGKRWTLPMDILAEAISSGRWEVK